MAVTSSPVQIPTFKEEPIKFRQDPTNQLETRKKRKRKAKWSTNSSPRSTTSQSRINSVERDFEPILQTKRKQIDNSPDGRRDKVKIRLQNEKVDISEPHNLFFIDLTPTAIPSVRQENSSQSEETNGKLLVPSHVTVLGSTPVEIISQPLSDSDDADFIDYLDYEEAKPAFRYYDDLPRESSTLNRTVCKNCGAEGEHKTSVCPIQICLTCGVRDEHSTRSCPISKVCFTCNMKGHINANCPSRLAGHPLMVTKESDCDRCSSSGHKTNECPTLWRLYEYFNGEEQGRTLALRQSKRDLKLGQGGEGFVADDQWCYNCGSYGHWGDDCYDLSTGQIPEGFSAFSQYNIMNGPFYDPGKEGDQSTSRSRTADWEDTDNVGWGRGAPTKVGRQARIKSKAALVRQSEEVADDPDDWFANSGKRNGATMRPRESKLLTFGKSLGGTRSYGLPNDDNGPPSLLARLGGYQVEASRPMAVDRRDYSTRRGNHARRKGDSGPPSVNSAERQRHVDSSGPRYRGGYSR